jgi:ESX secretion system protein EccD
VYPVLAISTSLAYVTVAAPRRRVDVALPADAPLAELLPELLRRAGDDLADAGEAHGGWALRRGDGTELDAGLPLAAQAVRDGDVLHLVAARAQWPEPEYDDLAEAVCVGARRASPTWDAATTRGCGLVAAGLAGALGLAALLRGAAGQPPWPWPALVALVAAALLLVAGRWTARGYGRSGAGACLAGYALPYAFVAGLLLLPASGLPAPAPPGGPRALLTGLGAPHALVASSALALAAVVGGLMVGAAAQLFVAGATVGLLGAAGALLGYVATAAGAAAVVLALLVLAVTALPLLAVRLGRLPLPPPRSPAEPSMPDVGGAPPPRLRVLEAVRRTEEILTGLLLGLAVAGSAAALLLVRAGGAAGQLLVACAATALALRARLFAGRRHRALLLAVALIGYAAAAASALGRAPAGWSLFAAAVFAVVAVLVAAVAGRYAQRAPSPYLGRAADALEVACLVGVAPVACAVLGLYDLARMLRW